MLLPVTKLDNPRDFGTYSIHRLLKSLPKVWGSQSPLNTCKVLVHSYRYVRVYDNTTMQPKGKVKPAESEIFFSKAA